MQYKLEVVSAASDATVPSPSRHLDETSQPNAASGACPCSQAATINDKVTVDHIRAALVCMETAMGEKEGG